MKYCIDGRFSESHFQEENHEATVQYVEGGFGPPKTEGFLPNVNP